MKEHDLTISRAGDIVQVTITQLTGEGRLADDIRDAAVALDEEAVLVE